MAGEPGFLAGATESMTQSLRMAAPQQGESRSMRQVMAMALGVLLAASTLTTVASRFLLESRVGGLAAEAVLLGASFFAAYHVARHATRGGYWLGVAMLVPATAIWVLANFIDSATGGATDFGGSKGNAILAIISAGVNLVLCVVGADVGDDLRREATARLDGPLANRRVGRWFWAVVGMVVLGLLAVGQAFHWGSSKANIWLIPEGCVGWVVVEYGVPDAPALPMEDGFGVITVPPSGRVLTSSDIVWSPRIDYHWYVRGEKRVAKARSLGGGTRQATSTTGTQRYTSYDFIGTETDKQAIGMVRDADGNPVPGLHRCK
jgi:hypothetical protein